MRTAIFHYHLFKNAGTSFDRILKTNFPDGWVTAEFDTTSGNNTSEVEDWIRANPAAQAYSSHTAVGPLPRLDSVTLVPVLFLRDPVERIASAYRFERKQQADTWGAELAKMHDLEGYVRARLARRNDRQCRNFQTARLATLVPGTAPELDRARQALALLKSAGIVGRVERFDDAMAALADRLRPYFPKFTWSETRANVSDRKDAEEMSDAIRDLLETANEDDRSLLAAL
jgi:hypothetical protein